MILVTFKVHATSPQAAQEICRTGVQTIERFQEPGWLRGRCLVNLRDPLEVISFMEWGSRSAWEAWRTSEARARFLRQLAPLTRGDWQTDCYEEV